jgi:hypothetical protein
MFMVSRQDDGMKFMGYKIHALNVEMDYTTIHLKSLSIHFTMQKVIL